MELLDVYDDDGNLTGKTMIRWKDKLSEHEHVRAAHIIIMNQDGMFLVQKRSATKRTRPSTWDITCGAVSAGETPVVGAMREVGEEVGLHAKPEEFKYIGSTMSDTGVFQDKFFLKKNFQLSDCTMQVEEVDELKLIDKNEFIAFIDTLKHRTEKYREQLKAFVREIK